MGRKVPKKIEVEPYSALEEMIDLKTKLSVCSHALVIARHLLDTHMIYCPELNTALEILKNED